MGRRHHDHDHGTGLARAGARHRSKLLVAFVLTAVFFVVEAVVGLMSNSLALLSDAGHMMTDVIGLGIALAAIEVATRYDAAAAAGAGRGRHTFGLYRLEVLAAFVNSLLLFGVAIWVVIEAVRRLVDGPEVHTTSMLIVAVLGLVVNLVAFAVLRGGASESLNLEGATLEVLADAVGSIGVIVAAALMKLFDWQWADPLIGALVGLWILPRTWRLGRRSSRVLLQSAPEDLDLDDLSTQLQAIPGVVDVHDLHAWTLTSDMNAASAHLMTEEAADPHQVLDQARDLLLQRFDIDHGTFQVEPQSHEGCHEVSW